MLRLITGVALLLAAFVENGSWIAQTGLSVLLMVLLVGGTALVVAGLRDVIRNFAHFLHDRSHRA